MNRKIDLPEYCNGLTGVSIGGKSGCDHDYPEESKIEYDEFVEWICSKCGVRRRYEVIK